MYGKSMKMNKSPINVITITTINSKYLKEKFLLNLTTIKKPNRKSKSMNKKVKEEPCFF
jgi:hypothetical protein